jgi:hypothetical protein
VNNMNSKKDLLQGKLREVTPTEMHAFKKQSKEAEQSKEAVWDRGYPIKAGFRFFWRMIKANELAKTTKDSDLYKKLLESEEEIFGTIRNNTRRSKVDVVLWPNNSEKADRDQNVKGTVCVRVWGLNENQRQELVNAIALWNLLGTLGAKRNTGCGSCVIDELDIKKWGDLLKPAELVDRIKLEKSKSAENSGSENAALPTKDMTKQGESNIGASSLLRAPLALVDDVLIKSGFMDQNSPLKVADEWWKESLEKDPRSCLLSGRKRTRKLRLVRFKIHQIPGKNKFYVLRYRLPSPYNSRLPLSANNANDKKQNIVRKEASSFKALDSNVTWEDLGIKWGRG